MNDVNSIVRQINLISGDPKDPVAQTGHGEIDLGMHVSYVYSAGVFSKPSNSDSNLWIYWVHNLHFGREVLYLKGKAQTYLKILLPGKQ